VSHRIRVVAGSAGGLWLKVPHRFPSRPTQDRVKQAIFSSLGPAIPGAAVLDLYAGTGALGIEALSRGAAAAVFVDNHPACIAAIRDNLQLCGLSGDVLRQEAPRFLESTPPGAFDVVFLDPPYLADAATLDDDPLLPLLHNVLRPGGRIAWEHSRRSLWRNPAACGVLRHAFYGDSAVTLLGMPQPGAVETIAV
jgi:16S rRNA (guanine966-N2)-methyltransferase